MRTLWLVNQLWVIVPVNPRKNRVSSELVFLKLINYSYGYKPIGVPHFGQVHVSWHPMKI